MFPNMPNRPPLSRADRERIAALEAALDQALSLGDEARQLPFANRPLLGRITALARPTSGQALYAWEYAVAEDGLYRRDAAGYVGEVADLGQPDAAAIPAWEVTGNCRVPLDGSAVAWLWPSAGGVYYSFFWPEGPLCARLTGVGPAAGRAAYDWTEQLAEQGGRHVDHPAGRSGTYSVNPAYELNGRAVPLNSLQFLERGWSAPPDVVTAILVHGDGAATHQAQTVTITGATGGTWRLTVFDETGNAYDVGPFVLFAPAEAVQDALRAIPAFAQAVVTGEGAAAWPYLIAMMDTYADLPQAVGDPFQLEGRQEWSFNGIAEEKRCTDVQVRTWQFDRCDYPVLNRYEQTDVYLCGALQFPVAEPVLLYAVGCCDCSGSGPPDSGSSGSEGSGSGPCPCPSPPLEVTVYATGILNGGCDECTALVAGVVLTETAPCVWSGTDGGIVCANVPGFGILTFSLFYSAGYWQLLIWYTTAAGQLILAAVYQAPAWDCMAELDLDLVYAGPPGPCIWPPRVIVIPGPPNAGAPFWCVQVDSGSGPSGPGGSCCPCWAAYASTAKGGNAGAVQTTCCPNNELPFAIPLKFSGTLAGLGTVTVNYQGDDGALGNTWTATVNGCAEGGRGGEITINFSCVEGNGYFFMNGMDALGSLFEAEWGTGAGLDPVCADNSPATFTAWTGPNLNFCAGVFGVTADLSGGDGTGCGQQFTEWGAVQWCASDGSLMNRGYFNGTVPCITIVGYYPSEAEAAQAAATFVKTGLAPAPSAPCGPDCESGSGPIGSIPRVITGANWCVHCTAGPLIGQVVCVAGPGAGTWNIGDGVTWDCGAGVQNPCTGTVVSGPYTDDCAGGCAQNQPSGSLGSQSGLVGLGEPEPAATGTAAAVMPAMLGGSAAPIFPMPSPGALLCLPQSMLTGVIAVGGPVSGPWGSGVVVNGPWPGPDCGGACAVAPPPPPQPCCYPLPDQLWLTCGGMLAPFGSVPLDSLTPGSGVGPWACTWWPRVSPTACGWITAHAKCDPKTGKFTVSGIVYAPAVLENVPPVPYAAFTAVAVPIECKPALLVPLRGSPDIPKIITEILIPGDPVLGVNQLQRVIIQNAAGGQFVLRITDQLDVQRVIRAPYAASADTLQRVIRAEPSLANTEVTGDGTQSSPYLLRMIDTTQNLPLIQGDAADLTPGPPDPAGSVQKMGADGPCPLDDFNLTLTD